MMYMVAKKYKTFIRNVAPDLPSRQRSLGPTNQLSVKIGNHPAINFSLQTHNGDVHQLLLHIIHKIKKFKTADHILLFKFKQIMRLYKP